MYVRKTPGWLKLLYPGLVWDYYHRGNTIYLTFDDGPVPGVTPFVVETLRKHGAKATFFCVGENVSRYPEIYRELVSEGHSSGNHTFNHLNGWKTPDLRYLENIGQCQELLTGSMAKPLFRPPYGRIKRSQIKKLKDDYHIVMWDLLTGDFDHRVSPQHCLEKAISLTRPGSIVIFHDSQKAWKNLNHTLPRYLEHFVKLGFEFRSL